MSDSLLFDGPSLRKLLSAVLPTASDLEAFCLDSFPEVGAKFASGQNRVDRDNLLLQIADAEELVAALAKRNPRRFARYKRLLLSPRSAAGEAAKNPYRGLSAFQVEETDLFFGRDELTERLWQRLQSLYEQAGSTRLLTVLGPSGSGKSSVARAGLLAELKTSPIPGPDPVRCIVFKPGDSPLGALAIALLAPSQESATAAELSAQRDLADVLRKPNGRGEFDGLSVWAANRPGVERSPVVVLVDQFEEVYTLCTELKERDAFAGVLLHAAAARSRNVSVVIALRSDFLGETHRQHPVLNRLISQHAVIVDAMSRDELRQVIAEPAAQAGTPIDDTTVELLLSQAWGNEGTLPLLEFALTRIWEGMREGKEPGETLREVGGVGGALAGKAQEIFKSLSNAEKRIARRALVRLAHSGEGAHHSRRRAVVADLCGRADSEADVLGVLRKFSSSNARLLTLSSFQRETLAEVTHEALFEHWTELAEWLDENRDDRRALDRVAQAARLWDADGRQAGRLWRSPDLEMLRSFAVRAPEELSPLQSLFLQAAERQRLRERVLIGGGLTAVALALGLAISSYVAKERQQSQRRLEAAATAARIAQQEAYSTRLRQVEQGGRAALLAGHPSANLDALTLGLESLQGSTTAPPAAMEGLVAAALDLGYPRFPAWPLGNATDTAQGGDELPQWLNVQSPVAFAADGRRVVTAGEDGIARVWDVTLGTQLATLKGHKAWILSACFSPDGGLIATASRDRTVRLWDARTGSQQRILEGHTDAVNTVLFSPDGTTIVTASWDKTARLWDTRTGKLQTALSGHSARLRSAQYSSDGTRIVTASWDHTARLWDSKNGSLQGILSGHSEPIYAARFSPNSQRVVTASADNTARVWDVRLGRPLAVLRGHRDAVTAADFSPDGKRIVTTSYDTTVRLWDSETGTTQGVLNGHRSPVLGAQFSPDGELVVSAGEDATARLWDSRTGSEITVFRGHRTFVLSALFSPDGTSVATASADGTARLWDARRSNALFTLSGHTGQILGAHFSADGSRLVTTAADDAPIVWNTRTGAVLSELKGHSGGIWAVKFAPVGTNAVTASADYSARLWDTSNGATLAELRGHKSGVLNAAFSSDGLKLITTSWDKTARLWDSKKGTLLRILEGHTSGVYSAAFSPDSSLVATASWDHTARIWDVSRGVLLSPLAGHTGGLFDVSFSPDGAHVVTASHDMTARLWNAQTGALLMTLRGHTSAVNTARFSADGSRVVTSSFDGTARLFDAKSGACLAVLRGHTALVISAIFSPDGARVLTASGDGSVRLWDAGKNIGHTLATFVHPGYCTDAVFSPDGSQIATACADRFGRIFSTDANHYAMRACEILRGHPTEFNQVQDLCRQAETRR